MEANMQRLPKLGYPSDSFSGLSTIMVANIQETKDRISQIEYIFCSQLFPMFQMNTQSPEEMYSEARKAAEDAYTKKERDLLLQINKLQYQNQQFLEENKLLRMEKVQFVDKEKESCNRFKELQKELNQKMLEANEKREVQQNLQKRLESNSTILHSYEKTKHELEERNAMLLKMRKKLELDTEGLQQELIKKSKEVDDMMELQNKLLQVNQSKFSLILEKENQLKEYEEKNSGLVSKLEKMESKVKDLLSEVKKGKELQGNLLKKIEFQATEIMNNEQLANKYENENRLLSSKVTCLSNRADELQTELEQKNSELEEVKKMHQQLFQQSDSSNLEIVKRGQALEEFKEEKKRLLDKNKGLEEKVDNLQRSLSEGMRESSEGMELHRKLLQQIEAKDSELNSEKGKLKEVFSKYKNLKSQYNYLLKKCNLELPSEGEDEERRHNQISGSSHDLQINTLKASDHTSDIAKRKDEQEVVEEKKEVARSSPASSPISSHTVIAPKLARSSKVWPSAGIKRPHSNSYWRDTRSHQSRVGPDPHDDFLDTPLENVRDKLGKSVKEVDNHRRLDDDESDDDQTQDLGGDDVEPNKLHKSHPPPPPKEAEAKAKAKEAGTSGFKYVEAVRKKSERQNLKGVECKQCKKFYDAILPGDATDNNQNIVRCEHHEGVSRHRYRYAPPSTPEGFWNIGFESEM